MAVTDQTPINSSTGNGATTVFPYTFKIIAAADLEVSVDGVVKTLNTDYTVSGAGNDAGGNVTFTTAPANLSTVVRRRNMAFTRATDYQYQGDLPNDVLNADQDAPVLMIQQIGEGVSRALKIPPGETTDMVLPTASERANLYPVFDASGNLTTSAGTGTDSGLRTDLAASGGSSLVAFIQSGTDPVARTVETRIREGLISLADFAGLDPTGVDDSATAITNARATQGSTRILFVPRGTYKNGASTYTVDADWMWINKGYTSGVNTMALAENQAFSVTFQTSTAAVLDSKLSRIGIGVTGAAYGAQHADCFRGNLYNSSTDGNGNTVIYAHAQSMGSTNWTASLHGEFRHGGGTSSGLNIEASSHSAAGSFYGAVISNTSASLNAAGTTNVLTGALPVSHASATGLLITGTNNTNAMGGWVTGINFHQNSMRAGGTCITFNQSASVSSHISTSSSSASTTADILLQGNSANGILLNGTYTGLALRVNAGQSIGMEATGVIRFSYTAPSVSFYNGANDRVALDLSATPGLRVDTTKVVGPRKTGWATATGTATRSTFDTAAVTLPQLAERVKALIDDLHSSAGHGLIGS